MTKRPILAVIDYGMSNLRSVCKAWEHVGADVSIIQTPSDLGRADALIFPGQGGIKQCIQELQKSGLDKTIKNWIESDKPYFGICLGLQALFEFSEEGNTTGLGILPGTVIRFNLPAKYKIPHMGWNSVNFKKNISLNNDLSSGIDQFYFVHSYFAKPKNDSIVWCETTYGDQSFVSGIAQKNCYATQFHPEKSQAKGMQLYKNFLNFVAH